MDFDEILAKNYKQAIQCFDVRPDERGKDTYFCQINQCSCKYFDKSAAIRHVRTHHKNVYTTIQGNRIKQPDMQTNNESIEIRVRVNPKDILNACVDLVTANALPLSVLECPAFKKVIEPYVIALKLKGIDLVINRKKIKTRIAERAQKIKKKIVSQLRNKMICLMIDIASRYNRSILGVNAAYFDDGKIKICTIGMHAIRCSQTATNITNIIKKNLSDFSIQLSQIVSITTDNGKNLIKAVNALDSSLYVEKYVSNCDTPASDSSEDDFNIDGNIFDDQYYEDLLTKVRNEFNECCYTNIIHGISCAAHCLNLVVSIAINKTSSIKNLLQKCRALAKKLRTPSYRMHLTNFGCNMAKIDVVTRWNSIFSMVIFVFPYHFIF